MVFFKMFVLTTHEKRNKKFSEPLECFMPEGVKNSLFGSTKENNLSFGLGNEKKISLLPQPHIF